MQFTHSDPGQVEWAIITEGSSAWDAHLEKLGWFALHQTYAWGEFRRTAGWMPVRMVAKNASGQIRTACQMLVRRRFGIKLAWIPGGAAGDRSLLDGEFIRAVRSCIGGICYLRMNDMHVQTVPDEQALASGGWTRPACRLSSGLTLEYDLAPEAVSRLAMATGNWRHNLKRSAKYGLRVERWQRPDAGAIAAIYREMEEIKGGVERVPERDLAPLLNCYGDRLVVCRALDEAGQTLALRAAVVLGNKAWDMLAAAGAIARKNYASYAVFWQLAEECRLRGALTYDLGGVDPEGNKGVYDFKKGTGAKLVQYLGEWDRAVPGILRPLADWYLRTRGTAI